MLSQRVRGAESRAKHRSANGPRRVQGKGRPQYLQREGMRQLPEICWYLAKGTATAVNQGGTADLCIRP